MSDGTNPGARQLDALETQELLEETETGLVPPITVFTIDNAVFKVTDVDAWEWHPHGIFGTGSWDWGNTTCDALIPTGQIKHIEFDFDALDRYNREQGAPDG